MIVTKKIYAKPISEEAAGAVLGDRCWAQWAAAAVIGKANWFH